ncbi:MAG: hypothetical protein PHS88_07275 [Candidatus Omnitrophica bacterium]|nr:hypothetical protein [Candidatus Omnitrophota bacterium]
MAKKVKRDWKALTVALNELHSLLQQKPRREKCGFQGSPGGILNAYREGDVTFEQAVRHLKGWAKRHGASWT